MRLVEKVLGLFSVHRMEGFAAYSSALAASYHKALSSSPFLGASSSSEMALVTNVRAGPHYPVPWAPRSYTEGADYQHPHECSIVEYAIKRKLQPLVLMKICVVRSTFKDGHGREYTWRPGATNRASEVRQSRRIVLKIPSGTSRRTQAIRRWFLHKSCSAHRPISLWTLSFFLLEQHARQGQIHAKFRHVRRGCNCTIAA
ncbi:hypothetical protein OF83DRAFT_188344 [Amylostereum chailletii]|nr:hypothetical protein OF83DRAFT_188344 [Amylostereum chailletii]